MELASAAYARNFRFASEGLPEDLKRRGMAKETQDGELRLTLEDYPYATDGLLIWSAIETWVLSYLNIYYKRSPDVTEDKELMAWWEEIQLNGHPDIVAFGFASESEMWPRLENIYDLTGILTTILWMVSGHHAAVDFGQYAYGDFFLNQPTLTVQRMPFSKKANGEKGVPLDEEVYLDTVNPLPEAIRWSATSKILSTHHPGEQYLGQEIPYWFSDEVVLEEFATFRTNLEKAEGKMKDRNEKGESPLRISERKLPYTRLCPNPDDESVVVKGVPNSVSI
ncbi:hypothetical protein BSKO_06002 [Bryopsis sp. KO-2023]|nr:hypothetical protein BSKO_06002 [Bryopsis sp. KO-2023]